MKKRPLKEWTPPRAQEVYTETLRPNDKVRVRDYEKRTGDQFAMVAEFPVCALPLRSAWKEAMRAARAVVRTYLVKSVMVMHVPKAKDQIFECVRVYERYNLNDFSDEKACAS